MGLAESANQIVKAVASIRVVKLRISADWHSEALRNVAERQFMQSIKKEDEMTLRTGRQLKAARALAGIAQSELAAAAGLHTNSVRRLERMEQISRYSDYSCSKVEDALLQFGIECTADPLPGVAVVAAG